MTYVDVNEEQPFERTEIPPSLPALRLASTVVFPSDVVSVQIDRPRTQRMIEAFPGDATIVECLLPRRDDQHEPGSLDDFHPIAVACRVIHRMNMPGGNVQVVFQGLRRIRVRAIEQAQPFLTVRAEALAPREPRGADVDGAIYRCMEMVDQLVTQEGGYPPEMVNILRMNIAGGGRFADLLGAHLNLGLALKRRIVATESVRERLKIVEETLQEGLARVQVESDIARQVRVDIDQRQREHLLRAQLKRIRQELGIEGDAEADLLEMRERIAAAGLPEEVEAAATREADRLASMTPASAEFNVIRTYVDWILDLPWQPPEGRKIELRKARRTLDRDHYGLDDVKQRILEFLAVRRLKGDTSSQVLCLAGPPGVGKTSLGRSVAEAMGREFVRVSVGGMRDEAEIKGHRRTYVGAMPGKILQALKRCGTADPVFVVDEIDKMGSDQRGDPSSAMLEVLDPEQNHAFLDHYLDLPFDLSRVFFLCTANVLEAIPGPLRDRMEIVRLPGYTHHEKLEIAKRHVVPRVLADNGLTKRQLVFSDEALTLVIEGYTREAGVRDLKRQIGRICRARALEVATNRKGSTKRALVGPERVAEALGVRIFQPADRARAATVGVTAGLAWTAAGGDLLLIESNLVPGSGRLKVTGRLGEVMRESCEAALSYVKSVSDRLEIDPERFSKHDIHIHVPDGATPKDGPSAGVTIASCLASLLTGKPARADVAMTGEITLKGRVLPVGGVKEKVLAAHRAGIRQVLLPLANEKDVAKIPDEVRDAVDLTFTEDAFVNIETTLLQIYLPDAGTTVTPETHGVPPEDGTSRPHQPRG